MFTLHNFHGTAGKVTIFTVLAGIAVFAFIFLLDVENKDLQKVVADTATTSVTVLNTAPTWDVDAQEQSESSTTTPTNAGSAVTWVGTGNDSNGEDYFLLVCKNSVAPTPGADAPPSCDGGASNQWAVSATTTDEVQASASYTTLVGDAEPNDWYAWICDANPVNPKCNATYKQGTYPTASPFEVNHRPTFTAFIDNSPVLPGAVVTFMSTSSDTDVSGTADTVQLIVCKANDFTGSSCGAGGTWATSTLVASDAATSTTIVIPTQDGNYNAYGFVIDSHGFAASGGSQGTDSTLTISNATPTVSAATISLLDTDDVGSLTLLNENGQTAGFEVTFTVTDNNSCVANGSTTDELSSALVHVYRSGVGQASCNEAGEFNVNSCYTQNAGLSQWAYTAATQDSGSCNGPTDSDSTWSFTFPLWFTADPTDGASATDTTYFAENWVASVEAIDDNYATSTATEGTSGNELVSFLAYSLDTASIAFGSLEPGQQNDPITSTTVVSATGNVGLDETLYGESMCTTYSGPGSCSVSATSTIPVGEQVYATSSVSYASGNTLLANPGAETEINILKSTSTTTPATGTTYWGINIPATITLAGDYTGEDTIIGIKGEAQDWQ